MVAEPCLFEIKINGQEKTCWISSSRMLCRDLRVLRGPGKVSRAQCLFYKAKKEA